MHNIAVLGSTGSIGTQCLEVIAANPKLFRANVLVAYQNDRLLEQQIEIFKPDLAVLVNEQAAEQLRKRYQGNTKILAGEAGLLTAAVHTNVDTVVTALVGFAGLKPTLAAIRAKKRIALANKETLVAAGEIITAAARENGVAIIPVDSEHSAIFQCLQGEDRKNIKRLVLTASGGPFRGKNRKELCKVGVEACLQHPNWSMGQKVTVDSATLANKGLEVIEAKWLFGIDYDNIDVVVHPQSIIHSMVEYTDGAVIAQLGLPDMRLPIQYALSYPERLQTQYGRLDFTAIGSLTFSQPDTETFPALALAYEVGRKGGTLPCVFNAANEVAVHSFLAGGIAFLDIAQVIRQCIKNHTLLAEPLLEDLYIADQWARAYAADVIASIQM